VCTLCLIPPSESTEEPTAFPAMVSNGSAEQGHLNCICQDQEKKEERDSTLSMVGIPDRQPFTLKRSHMSQTREQERLEVVRGFWAWNDTPRKDISNLVALIGPEIDKYPYVDPAHWGRRGIYPVGIV